MWPQEETEPVSQLQAPFLTFCYKVSRFESSQVDVLAQFFGCSSRDRGPGGCVAHIKQSLGLAFKARPLQLTKEIEFVTKKMHFPLYPRPAGTDTPTL